MLYKKVEDSFGLKLNEVAKQYLIIEKENLAKLCENLGMSTDVENVLNYVEDTDTNSLILNEEEKNKLKETYLEEIKNALDNSSFTKVTTEEAVGYSLSLNTQKCKEIVVKLFEVLKTDENMLNKLNTITGQEIEQQNIEQIIESINSSELPDGNITITIFQSNNELRKIEIQINDQFKIEISKTTTDDELVYNVQFTMAIDEQNINVSFENSYSGIKALEDIKENYTLSVALENDRRNII